MSEGGVPGGGEFVLYQTEAGRARIQCRLEEAALWLSQARMASKRWESFGFSTDCGPLVGRCPRRGLPRPSHRGNPSSPANVRKASRRNVSRLRRFS